MISTVGLITRPGRMYVGCSQFGPYALFCNNTGFAFNAFATETLGRLPTGRDLWTAARLVPGVVMVTSAGSSASGGYDVGGTGSLKTGSNVLRGSLFYTGTHHALQADNVTPVLRQQLLATVPARVLQANPDLEPSPKILTFYNLEGSLTGPLVRNRLWFAASWNRKPLEQLRLGSYNPDGTQLVDDNLQSNYGVKLSWQATPQNQLHYVRQTSHRTAYHRLTGGDPTASFESRAISHGGTA